MTEYDALCRVVLTGAASTGKSSLMNCYVGDSFQTEYLPTIGVDFKIGGVIEAKGKMCKLQIWDTAGQTRFQTITQSYYRGSNVAIIVYAIDNRESFEQAEYYYRRVRQYNQSTVFVLVGNKTDVAGRAVSTEQARRYADSREMLFEEVSARDSPQLFRDVVRRGVERWVPNDLPGGQGRGIREPPVRQPPEELLQKKIQWWEIAPVFILVLVLILIAGKVI